MTAWQRWGWSQPCQYHDIIAGFLAGEEQLGNQLGHGWIHPDVQEQAQQLWDCHPGQLPGRLGNMSSLIKLASYKYLNIL